MKKKVFLVSILVLILGLTMLACNKPTPPVFSEQAYAYDLTTDASLVAELDLKGKSLTEVALDGTALAEDAYTHADGTLTVTELFMKTLSQGTHELTARTSDGAATVTLTVTKSVIDPVFAEESYLYDLWPNGDLAIGVDLRGFALTEVKLDSAVLAETDYTYADGTLTVREACLLGASLGAHAVTVTTTAGQATVELNVVETAAAPEFAHEQYLYDLAVAGTLDCALALNNGNLMSVRIEETYLNSEDYTYEDGTLILTQACIVALGKGDYELTVLTDEGSDTAQLSVVNSIVTSFDDVTESTYEYGKDTEVEFEADFGKATVTAVTRGEQTLPASAYSYKEGTFTLSSDILDRVYGTEEFVIALSNFDVYRCTVTTNVLFYTDYDVTTIHNEMQNEFGLNPMYQATSTVSIVDGGEGWDGKVFRYGRHETTTRNEDAIFTFGNKTQNPASTWHPLTLTAGKCVVVEFDYAIYDAQHGGDVIAFQVFGSGALCDELVADEAKHHARYILSCDGINDMAIGRVNYQTPRSAEMYMLLDHFRVTEIDATELAVTMEQTEYSYHYGTDNGLTVSATFGSMAQFVGLTYRAESARDLAYYSDTTVPTTAYTFDRATGIAFSKEFLDTRYGVTTFTLTTTGGVKTVFTVRTNVLFYSDYDATQVHDGEPSMGNKMYQHCATISFTPGGEGWSGNVLKYAKVSESNTRLEDAFMTFTNTTVDPAGAWYQIAVPAGQKAVIEFEYAIYGHASDADILQFVVFGTQGSSTILTADGNKHTMRCEIAAEGFTGFAIARVNWQTPRSDSMYMYLDNMRITAIGTAQ